MRDYIGRGIFSSLTLVPRSVSLERFFYDVPGGTPAKLKKMKSNTSLKNTIMTKTAQQTKKISKVLIVEDEGDMCLLLNILLNGDEMELDHVQNLLAADEYLQKEQPSVIILDNKLPDGYGVDFISYIKKRYPAIRIIMISGFDASARDVAIENGADIFLEKPFTRDQLYTSIKSLLN
jgi:two-component system OmpR family response regulator